MGEIETNYGVRLGFTSLRASDGVAVSLVYLVEDNKDQAALAFKNELARASKIVERVSKKDKDGKIVGERVLVLMPVSRPGAPPLHMVIWTTGPGFYEISSPSLKHVLDLEQMY